MSSDTDDLLKQAVEAVRKCNGNKTQAAEMLGIPRKTLAGRLQSAAVNARAKTAKHAVTDWAVAALKDEVRTLRAKLESVRKETLDDEYVQKRIIGLKGGLKDPPNWLLRPMSVKKNPQVPTLFGSDWHFGEKVDPNQINHVNSFDLAIAESRARRMIEKTVALLTQYIVIGEYPGIVFALGGDMMSGDIHDELKETNEVPNMVALLRLFGVLVWCITQLAEKFGNVFVPCVTGNHGRNTKKPRAKGRNYTNFDWLLYKFLEKHFEDDKRVTFHVAEGPDAHWSIFGYRYCMTHGDQFRGGDGMIGPLGPITRGDHKKRTRNMQIDMAYDTLMMGHWHQLIMLMRLIVNGSLKGYDEYADQNNFGFEIPQQGLWITHPEQGINWSMPVHLEAPRFSRAREWVKWTK